LNVPDAIRQMENQQPLEGFLLKKSPKTGGWKKRFFFIQDFELVYREKGGTAPLGNIMISKIVVVRPSDDDKDTKKMCFQIDTPDRIFFLQGMTLLL
jgi:hypothetical protein